MQQAFLRALAVLGLCLGLPVQAASLDETLRQALERHPEHARLSALQGLEAGYRRQADSLFGGDPALQLSIVSDAPGSDFGYQEYQAGVSVPVWLPGRRAARRGIAEGLAGEAGATLAGLRWQVAGELIERAWAVRLAEADLAQARVQLETARALEHDVTHRHEAGELPRNDLLMARQERLASEAAFRSARGRLEAARLAWRNYTGLDELPEDLEAWAKAAESAPPLERHPRLRAALARLETARARVADARAQRREAPEVTLFARRDRGTRLDPYTESLGVDLSLPFGTGVQAAPAIAEAEAARTEAEITLRQVRRELALGIARAREERERTAALLDLARAGHEAATARLRLAQRAFELGEMDLFQLLQARKQAAEAARELHRREQEAARAVARYNHWIGVIPQ